MKQFGHAQATTNGTGSAITTPDAQFGQPAGCAVSRARTVRCTCREPMRARWHVIGNGGKPSDGCGTGCNCDRRGDGASGNRVLSVLPRGRRVPTTLPRDTSQRGARKGRPKARLCFCGHALSTVCSPGAKLGGRRVCLRRLIGKRSDLLPVHAGKNNRKCVKTLETRRKVDYMCALLRDLAWPHA